MLTRTNLLTLVLDTRSGQRNRADGLRLTNATATGHVNGYTVESQRRSASKVKGLSMRLTAPDGRVLDVVGDQGISATNAQSPVTSALSEKVGFAFRTRRSQEQTDACVQAIEAVITTGHECLLSRISGDEARHRVQTAALGLDYAIVESYLAEVARLYDLSRPGGVRLPTTAQVGWLVAAGFTAADLPAWFPTNDFYSPKRVRDMGMFRDNGWTANDMAALKAIIAEQENISRTMVRDSDRNKWASIPPGSARTAAAAGLTPADARRLLRTGVYDEPSLRLVTALQDDPIPAAV